MVNAYAWRAYFLTDSQVRILTRACCEKCVDKSKLELYEGKGMGWFDFAEAERIIPEPYKFCIRKLAEFIG